MVCHPVLDHLGNSQHDSFQGITTPPPLASWTICIDIGSQKVDERFLFTSTPNRDMDLAYLCRELRATNKTMLIYVWTQQEAERITKVLHKLGAATATLLRTDYPPAARAAALKSPVLVTVDEATSLTTTTPPLPSLPRADYIINFGLLSGSWKNPPLC